MTNDTDGLKPRRTVVSFWPFTLWILPFIIVYALGHWELQKWCGREVLEQIALPLVLVSVVSYGLLAWRRGNELAKVLFVLSVGFFCREWHFAGTSKGIYVLIAIVAGWSVYRRKRITALIKDTPVEIWLWAACLCYVLSQVIARRAFGSDHLNILPMEEQYNVEFEETMETLAHLMLAVTSLVAWRQFDAKKEDTN
ncbi:MAG: hypothetical protein ACYSUG_04865 [Planctomycetota bacterium]|jgi:hypothetical protein